MRRPLRAYLDRCFAGARVVPLAADASTRRYYRIETPAGPSRVVMDYGEPFDAPTDDVILADLFRTAGLRVAEVVDQEPTVGCLILEDLGDHLLETALSDTRPAAARRELLERAVDLAADVASVGTPGLREAGRPARLDAARFRFEMHFFVEHFVRGFGDLPAPPACVRRALDELADRAGGIEPAVLCHRDFHSRNLMLLADGSLAMVDIQDARWGPRGYDLASLLRDAYVDLDESWVDPAIDRYLERLASQGEAAAFRRDFAVLSAQRMLKALGTFGYQSSLGRSRYLDAIPRTIRRLERLLPRVDARLDPASLGLQPPRTP